MAKQNRENSQNASSTVDEKKYGQAVIEQDALNSLINVLTKQEYKVIGPTIKDSAVVLDEIFSIKDLPLGWTDDQNAARYRLVKHSDNTLFHYTVGQHSWKEYLYPPKTCLWRAKREKSEFKIIKNETQSTKYALIGVRACDLHAIQIHDRVFAEGQYKDPNYMKLRSGVFIVAVNCSKANPSCFCTSMGTGPKATGSFDLSLTEIQDKGKPRFFVEAGSQAGADVLAQLQNKPATTEDITTAEQVIGATIKQIKRSMDTKEINTILPQKYDHPRWQAVGDRCLNCSNCTMVCPTCFCSGVEDYTDLTGNIAERQKKWDSCFSLDYSYIHGGSIRVSASSRYRQWLVHKLATWHDQFGISGCVGCGRCITWCPVGIDITEEVRAIRKGNK